MLINSPKQCMIQVINGVLISGDKQSRVSVEITLSCLQKHLKEVFQAEKNKLTIKWEAKQTAVSPIQLIMCRRKIYLNSLAFTSDVYDKCV